MQQSAGLSPGPRRPPPRRRRAWTARAAQHDLSARAVVLVAATAAGATAALEIGVTGRLGWFFDVMFVLVSVTNALGASRDAMYAPMVAPPAVLLAVVLVVSVVEPTAIDEPGTPPNASVVQLVVVAVVQHALALAAGFGAALAIVGWRRASEPAA